MTQGPMPISRRQLAASVLAACHIAERHAIAAFITDAASQPAPNAFPQTSVGAVRQVWRLRAAEFQSFFSGRAAPDPLNDQTEWKTVRLLSDTRSNKRTSDAQQE